MSYMRYVFRSDFGGDKLALTRVQDLEFEKFCLDQYMKMIFRQIKAAEAKSTLEADLLLMKNQDLSANQKSALTLRISKKSILRCHVNLSEYLLEYINESATIFQELKGQGLAAIDKMVKELYLKEMKKEGTGPAYYSSRLHVKAYLQGVYDIYKRKHKL